MRSVWIAVVGGLITSTGLLASGCSEAQVSSVGPPVTLRWDPVQPATGIVGQPLDRPALARVRDESGNPVPGVVVDFEVTKGGGTLSRHLVATDDSGAASTEWTPGATPGVHELRARVDGAGEIYLSVDVSESAGGGGNSDGGAVLYQENWDYPSTAALLAEPSLNPKGSGVVLEREVFGLPWGGRNVLRADFPGGGSSHTAGIDLLPSETRAARLREVWFEVWIRFDAHWRTAGDHKTLFLLPDPTPSSRWEIKAGLAGNDLVGEIANGTVHKEISCIPPVGADGWCPPADRPSLSSLLWDGGWHLIQWHARMSGGNGTAPDGVHEAWIDGTKVLESTRMVTSDPGKYFSRIALGRNADPIQAASIRWGRVRVFRSDPGWR